MLGVVAVPNDEVRLPGEADAGHVEALEVVVLDDGQGAGVELEGVERVARVEDEDLLPDCVQSSEEQSPGSEIAARREILNYPK